MQEEMPSNSCFTCLCQLIMILMNPVFDIHALCNYTPKWQAPKVGFLLISFYKQHENDWHHHLFHSSFNQAIT